MVQGHPKLLELADAQARDLEALVGHLARAVAAWEGDAGALQAFFREGESSLPAEAFLAALDGWTRGLAVALPAAARTLFYALCALEDEDRQEGVMEGTWGDLWRRLARPGDVPALAVTLVPLIETGLVEVQRESKDTEWYVLHPGVAEVGRALAGEAVQVAVDHALAACWGAIFRAGLQQEGQGMGPVVIAAGRQAVPYLLRQRAWAEASTLLEHVIVRNPSSATLATMLPLLRRIATATAGTARGPIDNFKLGRALLRAGHWPEAETRLREVSQVGSPVARSATGELINLLLGTGRLEEALALCDERRSYTRDVALGHWAQLKDEGQRLQVLAALGRDAEVLAAVEGHRTELRTLPEVSAQEDRVAPWNVREIILDAGRSAALHLGRWETALELNAEAIAVKEARGAMALEVAKRRFNDYFPLLRLARYPKAHALLQACRTAFEAASDVGLLGNVFSALAALEDGLNHSAAALAFEETAIRYAYMSDTPGDCATCHFNLGIYVSRAGGPPEVPVAHWLAAAVIRSQTGSGWLHSTVQAIAQGCAAFAPDPPPLPSSFQELCGLLEQVEGVHFRELCNRLP
jgi:tetratricopeptide (TPR) repeat protein